MKRNLKETCLSLLKSGPTLNTVRSRSGNIDQNHHHGDTTERFIPTLSQILYEDGYEEVIHLADQRIQIQVFPGRDPILVTEPGTDGEAGARAVNGGAKKKRKKDQSGDGGTEGPRAELGPSGLPNEGEAVWGKVKGGRVCSADCLTNCFFDRRGVYWEHMHV